MNDINQIFQDYLAKHSDLESIDLSQLIELYPQHKEGLEKKIKAYQKINNLFNDSPSEETPSTLIGQVIGGCRIISIIGQGGMGVVYLAYQEKLKRNVVLKILRPFAIENKNLKERFSRESKIIAKLKHRGILTIYDVDEENSSLYIIAEHVEGLALNELIEKIGDIPRQQLKLKKLDKILELSSPLNTQYKTPTEFFCQLIVQVAEALQYAHENGIVHRDIKPSNIMIRKDGRPILLDFGLSHDEIEQGLTLTSDFLGTPLYSAPELFSKYPFKNYSQLDVYSLGVTLYELLTGGYPYEGKSVYEIYSNLKNKKPISPRTRWKGIPCDLEVILETSIAKETSFRYQSIADFKNDLVHFLCYEPIRAKPPSITQKLFSLVKRRKKSFFGTIILIVCMVAILITYGRYLKENFLKKEQAKNLIAEALDAISYKNNNKAFKYLELAQELDPQNSALLEALAQFHIQLNQIEDAQNTVHKLLQITPFNPIYLGFQSEIFMKSGHFEKAKELDSKIFSLLQDYLYKYPSDQTLQLALLNLYKRKDSREGTHEAETFLEKKNEEGGFTYIDRNHGFQFHVPFQWIQVPERVKHEVIRFNPILSTTQDYTVDRIYPPMLSYFIYPNIRTIEELKNMEQETARDAYHALLINYQELPKAAGDISSWIEETLIFPRYSIRIRERIFFKDGQAHVLLAAATEEDFSFNEANFNMALKSFEILN